MAAVRRAPYTRAYLLVAIGILGLASLRFVDLTREPYSGYWIDRANYVTRVVEGSPADLAGLKLRDHIRQIAGVDTRDTKAFTRQRPARIGGSRRMLVLRGADTVRVRLTYKALPAREWILALSTQLVGLCFLAAGIWAYNRRPGVATTTLACLGLALALAFNNIPAVESPDVRPFVWMLPPVLLALGVALLLRFLLLVPYPNPILKGPVARRLLYLPALAVAGCALWFAVVQPAGTRRLNVLLNFAMFGPVAFYLGIGFIVLLHTWLMAQEEERQTLGLNQLILAAIIGVLPAAAANLMRAFWSRQLIPYSEFYVITLLLAPFALARVALKAPELQRNSGEGRPSRPAGMEVIR